MNLFWVLCALLANHCCLGDDKDSELCISAGELPAPAIFLNATSAPEGESIAVLCTAPSEVMVTRFFFCKNGTSVSIKKATFHTAQYIVYASPKNAGQYSCGYQQNNAKNQVKTSVLSVTQNLLVPSDISGRTKPSYIWIFFLPLVFLLLVSAPIITCFMEKFNCFLVNPRN